jgi:hypothetical protein
MKKQRIFSLFLTVLAAFFWISAISSVALMLEVETGDVMGTRLGVVNACRALDNASDEACLEQGNAAVVNFDWGNGEICVPSMTVGATVIPPACFPDVNGYKSDLNNMLEAIPLAVIFTIAAVLVRKRARQATG